MRTAMYIGGALLIFAAIFVAVWCAAFYVLYEFIYGDNLGGRWADFTWPIATIAAFGGATVFLGQTIVAERYRKRVYAWCFGTALAAFAVANVVVWNHVY